MIQEEGALALTPKQLEILRLIHGYRCEHRVSPTLREIACLAGVHVSTVAVHTTQLRAKGALSNLRWGAPRSLIPTDTAIVLMETA